MNELLFQITQTFLIPLSILFSGLCVSRDKGLRAFISFVGLLVAIAFFLVVKDVPVALEDSATIGLLSVSLGVAWILAFLWQTVGWIRQNRSEKDIETTP